MQIKPVHMSDVIRSFTYCLLAARQLYLPASTEEMARHVAVLRGLLEVVSALVQVQRVTEVD